ncbi:ATP-binding protein [Candidatus Neomarinimicrobiota bacterium]
MIVLIMTVNLIGWTAYYFAARYFEDDLGKKLVGIAETSADLMDTELLSYLHPGDESGLFYQSLQHTIRLLKNDFRVDRIYIIDHSLRTLVDTESGRTIGSELPHLKSNTYELQQTQAGTVTQTTLYRGSDGTLYKSAFAPIRNSSGNVIAIAGVDASPEFLDIIDDLKTTILVINLISLIFAFIISYFLAKVIVRPVNKLVGAAERISAGKLSESIAGLPGNEIGYLGDVFNTMQDNIKDKEATLHELRRAAENRAESIKTYNDYILQSINNGVLTIDLEGRITVLNNKAKQLLRIEDLQCVNEPVLKVLHAEHPIRPAIEKRTAKAPDHDFFEITLNYPDGMNTVSVQVSPLLDAAEQTIGINFVFTDMTELYALQEKIKEQERMAYLGQLSATIAHEIRNPLNSMALFLGMLKREVDDSSDQQEIIVRVEEEIVQLNDVVNDFLLFAKLPELNTTGTEIESLIEETLFLAEKDLKTKEIQVVKQIPDSELIITGDPNQLKRAFLNLVLNAVDAMDTGGVLTVSAGRDSAEADRIEISFQDTGTGIASNEVDEIFKPFYSTRSQGTGLGLSIVRNIIHAHGGQVSVESRMGSGSTFYVHLYGQGH